MPKNITKSRYNFTIDKKLFDKFREYCRKNCINMSAKMESYIARELKDDSK
jgi:post-segregation antitoxin (ccd killing protein)